MPFMCGECDSDFGCVPWLETATRWVIGFFVYGIDIFWTSF